MFFFFFYVLLQLNWEKMINLPDRSQGQAVAAPSLINQGEPETGSWDVGTWMHTPWTRNKVAPACEMEVAPHVRVAWSSSELAPALDWSVVESYLCFFTLGFGMR